MTHHRDTFVSLLTELARDQPDLPLYTFLDSVTEVSAVLTCRDVLRRAQGIASRLRAQQISGEPVMVLSSYGPDAVCQIFGVMMAGCTPVPVTFHRRLGMASIVNIIAHTGLRVVTGQQVTLTNFKSGRFRSEPRYVAKDHQLLYVAIEGSHGDGLQQAPGPPARSSDTDIAMIYPGLPGNDAGAPTALSHRELLTSVDRLIKTLSIDERDVSDHMLTALDLADGMALVMHVLLPVRARIESVFFPAEHALRKAAPWLQAISKSGSTIISAPPSVLLLAAHEKSSQLRKHLDLTGVRFLCISGDHVDSGIASHFIERYRQNNISMERIFVCYGLSAAGVLATADRLAQEDIEPGIESVVLQSFGARGLSRCVVLRLDDMKQTVLLAECATRQLADDWQGVVSAMMETVLADTGCRLDRVMLLRPASLPLAVSGIVLRQRCAAALADGSLMLRLLPVRGK